MTKSTVIAAFLFAAGARVIFWAGQRPCGPGARANRRRATSGPDYPASTGETVPRPASLRRQDRRARSQDPGGRQQDRQQHLQRLLRTLARVRRGAGRPAPTGHHGRDDSGMLSLYSTATCVFTEFAMKQISCAGWCRRSSSAFGGAGPPTRFSGGAGPWSPRVVPARSPRSFPPHGPRRPDGEAGHRATCRNDSMWQLDSAATSISSGSTAASTAHLPTTCGEADAGTSVPPSKLTVCARL